MAFSFGETSKAAGSASSSFVLLYRFFFLGGGEFRTMHVACSTNNSARRVAVAGSFVLPLPPLSVECKLRGPHGRVPVKTHIIYIYIYTRTCCMIDSTLHVVEL